MYFTLCTLAQPVWKLLMCIGAWSTSVPANTCASSAHWTANWLAASECPGHTELGWRREWTSLPSVRGPAGQTAECGRRLCRTTSFGRCIVMFNWLHCHCYGTPEHATFSVSFGERSRGQNHTHNSFHIAGAVWSDNVPPLSWRECSA